MKDGECCVLANDKQRRCRLVTITGCVWDKIAWDWSGVRRMEHQETKGASRDKGVRGKGQERYFVTSAMLSLQHSVGHTTKIADCV